MRHGAAVIAAAALLMAASGCSRYVSADDIEDELTDWLTYRRDIANADVTCAEDLPAEAGRSITCTVERPHRKPVRVVVTVDTVDGDKVHYSYRIQQPAQ